MPGTYPFEHRPRQRRHSVTDSVVVWGFVLSFAGLLVAGCFEAYKIIRVIPGAFASSSSVMQNPLRATDDDHQAAMSRKGKMTAKERAQYEERAAQQEQY